MPLEKTLGLIRRLCHDAGIDGGGLLVDFSGTASGIVEQGDNDMIITWSNTLSVGHESIDQEHKHVLDTMARIYLVELDKKSDEEVIQLFGELIDLIVDHFHSEETVMRANRYPDADDHSKLHGEFFSRITSILYLLETGSDRVAGELIRCVEDWASHHILVHDKKFIDFISGA
jgi:hemerythrin-like metal-binding protein